MTFFDVRGKDTKGHHGLQVFGLKLKFDMFGDILELLGGQVAVDMIVEDRIEVEHLLVTEHDDKLAIFQNVDQVLTLLETFVL
jgi:hypothetical protein